MLLVIIVSIQCCTNKGLDVPEDAVRCDADIGQGRAVEEEEEEEHELPAYEPRDSTTLPTRLSDEPPAYVEGSSSLESPRPLAMPLNR